MQVLETIIPPNELARQMREVIERQACLMCSLVDDLLDVSRIGRGKIALRKEPLDLVEVVRKVVNDYRLILQKGQLTLALRLPSERLVVLADRTRLAQIIGNLLQNAGKFTAAGGQIAIEVETDTHAGAAIVRVSDTRVGMDGPTLSQAF